MRCTRRRKSVRFFCGDCGARRWENPRIAVRKKPPTCTICGSYNYATTRGIPLNPPRPSYEAPDILDDDYVPALTKALRR